MKAKVAVSSLTLLIIEKLAEFQSGGASEINLGALVAVGQVGPLKPFGKDRTPGIVEIPLGLAALAVHNSRGAQFIDIEAEPES